MRKVKLIIIISIIAVLSGYAQEEKSSKKSYDPLDKGRWLIEANTGFGGGGAGVAQSANTGFGLVSDDAGTVWSIGGEFGYFIIENMALKMGLGYTDLLGDISLFSYKLGLKYYIDSKIPIQLDLTGASIKDQDNNPFWFGLQGGYAFFLNKNVSIEPGARYNISLNKDFINNGFFEFRIGFVIHL